MFQTLLQQGHTTLSSMLADALPHPTRLQGADDFLVRWTMAGAPQSCRGS